MKKWTALAAAGCVVLAVVIALLSNKLARDADPAAAIPTIGGWIPTGLDIRRAGEREWLFAFPEERSLPSSDVNEPHVTLVFGYPASINIIRLGTQPSGFFRAWVTVAGDKGGQEVTALGEGSGSQVEFIVPWKLARKGITSVKIAYKAGGPAYEATQLLDPSTMQIENGKSFGVRAPPGVGEGDDSAHVERSTLILLEDGKPLGPAHSPHDLIRQQGSGRYSHWGQAVLFSSSDGSDPRNNGKKYAIGKRKPNEVRMQVS